jgi:hypothetical protein
MQARRKIVAPSPRALGYAVERTHSKALWEDHVVNLRPCPNWWQLSLTLRCKSCDCGRHLGFIAAWAMGTAQLWRP